MLLLFLAVLPPLVQSTSFYKLVFPLDCEDIFNSNESLLTGSTHNGSLHSGVYTIYPAGQEKPVQVYCDMGCDEHNNHREGKWTVIQRRMDGSVNFYRPWQEYNRGFGNITGEFWLGLQNIFLLTYMHKYELRVDMEDFDGGKAYAKYSFFSVDPESSNYRLHISGYISGGAGDSMSSLNDRDFSTLDKNPYGCCVDSYLGGFWYSCWSQNANPNGLYKWGTTDGAYSGVFWNTFKGNNYSLKTIVMKIRRVPLQELKKKPLRS